MFVETVTPLVTVSTVPPVIANPDLLVRVVTVSAIPPVIVLEGADHTSPAVRPLPAA